MDEIRKKSPNYFINGASSEFIIEKGRIPSISGFMLRGSFC